MLVGDCSRARTTRGGPGPDRMRRVAGRVATVEAGVRCAAHPARPARDRCPRCGRPRCAADRDRGDCCALCGETDSREGWGPLPVLVGAGVAGILGAVTGAALGQEYVGAHVFSVVFPMLVGLVIAALTVTWAGPMRPRLRHAVGAAAAGFAGLSALLDFRFTQEPFGPAGRWLPPLAAAVAAGIVGVEALARRPVSVPVDADRTPVSTSGP